MKKQKNTAKTTTRSQPTNRQPPNLEEDSPSLRGKDHCAGLSGWTENEEGVPQNSEEVVDHYFAAHPEYKGFRHSLPAGYKYLAEILGDRVATGDFVAEVEDETSEEEIVISSGEETEEEEGDHQLVARLPTRSASRSVPNPSSSGAETGQKRTKEKKKPAAAQEYSKQLATKAAGRKKEREKKWDKLLRGVTEFELGSAKLIGDMMTILTTRVSTCHHVSIYPGT
jgi:hypothetical protein